MELRCNWCFVSLATNHSDPTYPCGHKLCHQCYMEHMSPMCVVCLTLSKISATKASIPETFTVNPQPRPPLHSALPPSTSPHSTPDLIAPSRNTTLTNTTHRSASQNHISETGFRSPPHKEDSHQSSLWQTEDNRWPNDSQQGERAREMRQPGTVQQLMKKFNFGIIAPQEGAAGWKKSEEDPREAQGRIQNLWELEPSTRSKDPHKLDSVTGVHPSAQLSKEQKTPHTRKTKNRASPPYPPKSPKDEYLDLTPSNYRETLPSPPRSRNASPSPSSTSNRSRISSSSQRPAHRSRSCPRTRETEHSSPSLTNPRDPSPSPSRPTNLPPSPSLARHPSPAPQHRSRSSSRARETGHSSPSIASPTVPPTSPSRPKDLPLSLSLAGKSSPAPTTPKGPFTFNSAGKDVKFPGKVIRGGSAEGAAPQSCIPTQQPHIKPALGPFVNKGLTTSTTTTTLGRADIGVVVNGGSDLPQHHHQLIRVLGDGLNHKTQGMEMKERGLPGPKHNYNQQQSESFSHEEKDCKHQEVHAQLRDPSVGQQNESQVVELDESGGQIITLTQENNELRSEVMTLREAKDTTEKEAMYWKEENDKQQEAARQEMDHFRKEQVRRLQEHRDNWEGRMKEMQAQITSQEEEKKQLRDKSNKLESELQQVTENLAKYMEYARQLEKENAHQQQERVKYGEEEKCLREQIHAKDAQLKEVVRLYQEEIKKVKAAEEEITKLIKKDLQNQEKLAAVWFSKEEVRCLIRERDSCQEEVDKLKKEETTRKEKMARLREEKDDYKMKLHELENEVTPLSRKLNDKVIACQLEIDELKSKEATLQEEATQLRRERDQCRDEAKERENIYISEVNKLKRSENKRIAELQQERDNLKGEVDHLKQATSTEKRRERDSYKEALDTLKKEVATLKNEVTAVRRQRDSYKEEADGLKARVEVSHLTERDINKRIADMELDIKNYKGMIAEHKGKEDTLKKQIIQLEIEKENHQQKVDAEISNLRKENEQVGGYRRRKETLEKQMEEMEAEREELIQQLLEERDEVQKLIRRENTLEKQLTETKTDRDRYKRERDEIKETADKLMRNNFTLTTERDCCVSNRKQERDKHKEEVERLKRTCNNEMMRLREEGDDYKRKARHLEKELEVALGASASQERKVVRPKKDLADIPPPPTPTQAAEDIEMVTVGPSGKEEDEEEEVATKGLPNLGNSCYINGVVQCLYHLPPLRNALTLYANLHYQGTHQHDQPETGVAQALAQLFGVMQVADDELTRLCTRDLKQVLGSHDEVFGGKQQQEAHDLFSAVVTWLHSDLRQYGALDPSCGSSLFEGQLETKMVCPRQDKILTHTEDAFTSISLPVVGVNTWPLKDLLDKHFREQTLEWDCDYCRHPHQCNHLTRLLTCPPVLVIHFSRVPDSKGHRKTKVDFPVSELSLQNYMAPDFPRSPTYKLVGVVCHVGSMRGGHYVAYCRYGRGRRGNKWRLCNDSKVEDVHESAVLSDENAHLLFYIQQ